MSPGFEQSAHQGIQRSIERECMFCHNAFPEVSAGSDAHWEAALFPSELPEGIGCQRCHGPGAEHIRTLLKGGSIEAVRDAIVNPADLPGEQRDSVCFQCHMLPSVSMVGARRVGLGTYSFRPGQVLSDYMVHVDIAEQGIESGERFEINHHAYRLIQSPCYLESEGALSCISCHNPHVKPASTAFREKSSGVCRGCHNDPENSHEVGADLQGGACIRCHMPTRRTSDVIEVTMTDHRIARGPFDLEALIKPVAKETRPVTGVGLLKFGDPPSGQHGDMYRFMAALRANRFLEPAKLGLERHLQRTTYSSPTPYIDLAQAQIRSGDFKGAESTSRRLIETYSELHVAYALLGMALLAQNHGEEAIENLLQSLAIQQDPETHFNLAAAYLQLGDIERAEQQLERALELRPYMAAAWKYKGIILNSRDEFERAREALVRSLQIEPLDSSVYRELITLLRKIGEFEEAERYLELGIRVSGDPSSLRSFE
jgi:predicted CXXCH cytochrome family protein